MKQMIDESEQYLVHSYNRYPVVLDHGEGVKLYDTDGKEYLDFGAGIAVCALGYGDKEYTDALKAQIDKGIHFSNYFYSEPLLQAAKGLAKATGLDRVFMANSGTEANEGALKMARKYAIMQGHENRHEIISMNKAFHGRSMGALSVTGTAKYREPFEPMLQGVTFADYNDLESVKAAVTENTYAIIVEAVQGEGGIYPANAEFLQGIRKLCDENDIIMICDEIQCGMGRSGKMFAYQKYDIVPDIVTMAKGIGNGITVGAIAAKEEVAKCLVPGDHGTTFGGNPLACAAVAKTLEIFEKREIPNHVEEVGEYLNECLQKLVEKKEIAVEIISMNKAFHGRSMGALSVTGTAKYREPFEPMLQGVTFADYNDLESVKAAVTENTYAIIVEAVQGEGGIYPANAEFLQGIRKLCDENDIIMICDEIQCGMGRSGKMFAYQKYDIVPDIVTMAKGIGNGITVGAIAAKEEVAKCLVPGDHGTTFGGNPLACAAVAKTLEIFEKREIPNHVEEVGEYLNECLQKLVEKKEIAVETRGMGLMRGLELSVPAGPYITKALEKGVIFMSAGANVIRFIPPLIIEKSDVDKMIAILDSVLDD